MDVPQRNYTVAGGTEACSAVQSMPKRGRDRKVSPAAGPIHSIYQNVQYIKTF